MKHIFIIFAIILASISSTYAIEVDNSLEDAVKETIETEKSPDVKMEVFSSCKDMSTVLNQYVKDYYEVNKDRFHNRYIGFENDVMMEDSVIDSEMVTEIASPTITDKKAGGVDLSSDDYSETNSQVEGVEESDIIKTDGDYIYYFNQKNTREEGTTKYLYIVSLKTQKIVKKLSIPKTFSGVQIYTKGNKLVILASNYDYNTRNYIQANKTLAVIYDMSNKESLKLLKIEAIDGSYTDSRLIGNDLYIVSQSNFDIPFYEFKSVDDIIIDVQKILPKKLELTLTSDKSKQNFKKYPYNLQTGKVDCNNIEYNFPTKETLKGTDFAASFTIVSHINLKKLTENVETKVIAGSTSEIHMSKDNLYLVSSLGSPRPFMCRGFGCIVPSYNQKINTLIHKYDLKEGYKASGLIPGTPLTQYSMDEYNNHFRILTSFNNWFASSSESYTNLYILDDELKQTASLEKIAQGEEFKSSRYMGDKLYLVTFERVDPFFVIDLEDETKPSILGELKIPGYSQYLHPYGDKYIIGLGRDTYENKYGGIRNGGIKLDIYEVNYDKKCGDSDLTKEEHEKCDSGDYKGIIAKQLQTKTFGGSGSESEALYNPRMFMWNEAKQMLFLPVTLNNYDEESYEDRDYFQGLLAVSLDADRGIREKYRVSHFPLDEIEKLRIQDCKEKTEKSKTCKVLFDGTEVCGTVNLDNIPKYCFKESTAYDYISQKRWEYNNYNVHRALWVGNNFYSISPELIKANDIDSGKEVMDLELK